MDVIIRNDLFTSYTGLIERVMRTNHRMLCTLSMKRSSHRVRTASSPICPPA